jgi:hypothetical protein
VADVFETSGAQESVGDGVGEDVGVGVADKPSLEGYLHPTEDEPPRSAGSALFREGMDVDA